MRRGRKRSHDPTIPSHVDQAGIPRGIYWDRSGRGRWFIFEPAGDGRVKRKTVATFEARLSDLHRIAEGMRGEDRSSLGWLLDQFNASQKFSELSARTQESYRYLCDVAKRFHTKTGGTLSQLATARMNPAVIQRIVDHIAREGHPSKANHLLRYLSRVFRWGVNRGYCARNPATGVEHAKERKLRRLPTEDAMKRVVDFARACGARKAHTRGSCAPYLWIAMELAFLCRLRGIEVVELTDANALPEGLLTNRHKGSRDNIVRWTPRLRAVWQAAADLRSVAQSRTQRLVGIRPEDRVLLVSEDGTRLRKSSFDSAWQRLIWRAMKEGVISREERFGPHDLKRRGITSTKGTRDMKKEASGHRSDSMLDVYDKSVPLVNPSAED